MSSNYILILLFLPCYLTFATKLPLQELLTDFNTDELVTSPTEVSQYVPAYYNGALPDSYYHASTTEVTTTESTSLSETTAIEPRSLPFLINFILLPKLVMKFAKALAFGVSVATTFGMFVFLLAATVGLVVPGLRNVERSGRTFVQEFYENIQGEKIEAGKKPIRRYFGTKKVEYVMYHFYSC